MQSPTTYVMPANPIVRHVQHQDNNVQHVPLAMFYRMVDVSVSLKPIARHQAQLQDALSASMDTS